MFTAMAKGFSTHKLLSLPNPPPPPHTVTWLATQTLTCMPTTLAQHAHVYFIKEPSWSLTMNDPKWQARESLCTNVHTCACACTYACCMTGCKAPDLVPFWPKTWWDPLFPWRQSLSSPWEAENGSLECQRMVQGRPEWCKGSGEGLRIRTNLYIVHSQQHTLTCTGSLSQTHQHERVTHTCTMV